MFPEEDVRTVRRWAGRRSEVEIEIDDLVVAIVDDTGDPLAELRWFDDDGTWRLHTIQRGAMRPDPLTGPTGDVEQLLGCVAIDASERLLG